MKRSDLIRAIFLASLHIHHAYASLTLPRPSWLPVESSAPKQNLLLLVTWSAVMLFGNVLTSPSPPFLCLSEPPIDWRGFASLWRQNRIQHGIASTACRRIAWLLPRNTHLQLAHSPHTSLSLRVYVHRQAYLFEMRVEEQGRPKRNRRRWKWRARAENRGQGQIR